jgi:hypothetical protein
MASTVQKNVSGLEVSMENPPLMREMDGSSDGGHEFRSLAGLHGSPGERSVQASTLHQFHAVKAETLVLPDFVDRHDSRVIQSRRRFGLNPEPLKLIRRGKLANRDALDGN